ncbi:MAG TPA: hypothetical protein VL523_07315 [Terriglobia bacterium]|nr:hypothetical protein [Terriglobia bacterium]
MNRIDRSNPKTFRINALTPIIRFSKKQVNPCGMKDMPSPIRFRRSFAPEAGLKAWLEGGFESSAWLAPLAAFTRIQPAAGLGTAMMSPTVKAHPLRLT